MVARLVLFIILIFSLFAQGAGDCRPYSGSNNRCGYYYCYFYSNTRVAETLTYCATNYQYRYYNYRNIYIYYSGKITFELNLPSNVVGLNFYIYSDSDVVINSTKVHSSLTKLTFYYKSYHFNQAYFFSYFPNLKYLYANAFLDFDYPQTFNRLSQLSYLYVNPPSGSLIWKFELTNDAFRGLTNLRTIELIRADMMDVRYAFHGLTRLIHLGLEGNKIDKLEPNIFKDLKSLTYLDLDGNGIDEVSDDAFNGLTALKYLSLSGNPLFPLTTLYKLNALTSLQIHYNSYRTLSPDPFEQLASLRYINADNPFFCDCSLRWTSVVSQYSLSIQSAYCLEPGKVYRTAITSKTLYTNCTAVKSYNCFSKSISCPTELVCRNTADSYACTCADGFSLSHTGQCYDEDECHLGIANCEHQCNNTIGSYECYCNRGYQLSADDRSCEDVDECALGIEQCLDGETCVNTIGSYACRETGCVLSCEHPHDHTCICCEGYRLFNHTQCLDIDECQEATDRCDMNCHNTKGSYQCSCDAGFQLVNETKCLDVDECFINNGGCVGLCLNTNGSFTCLSINISTVESYECIETGFTSSCVDPPDSTCGCCRGYHKSTDSPCVDTDECQESTHLCDMNCHNTKGSYRCSCDVGFQLVSEIKCLDVDECLINNGGCVGLCLNTNGSFTCLSINISTVESYECTETGFTSSCPDPPDSTCGCCRGYHKSTDSLCVDTDECQESTHLCDMNCHNTKGSYQCSCNEGYQLVDGNTCLDIDECLTNNGGCQGVCINVKGNFYCLSIDIATIESYECNEFGYPKSCTVEEDPSCSCCTGYRMQHNSICVDIDECDEATHFCEMKCQNSKGSYFCSCDQGYQLIHQNQCLDIDECLTNNGGCGGTCLNSNGSFSCLSYNITGDRVSITNTSIDANGYLLVILVILVILIIVLVVAFSIVFVVMRGIIKKNSYQAVFQPHPIERDGVYEVPSQDARETAMLLEKVNTSDDIISDNSVELYPAPIAGVQPAND